MKFKWLDINIYSLKLIKLLDMNCDAYKFKVLIKYIYD